MDLLLVLLIASLVGLVVAVAKMKSSPGAKPVVGILAVVAIALGAMRLFSPAQPSGGGDAVVEGFTGAAGYVLGERLVADLGEDAQVVLVMPVSNVNVPPVEDAAASGLSTALGRQVELFPLDRDRVSIGAYPYIEGGDIQAEVLAAHPEAGALVFLSCLPNPEQGGSKPRYGLNVSSPETAQGQPPQGFVAVVAPKQGSDWKARPKAGMTPAEIFAMRYELISK